ncbi:MAG: hypothetical protein AAFY41_19665 [Bacteroidota bacterium]
MATLFLVSVGGQAEANLPPSSLPSLSEITSNTETVENPQHNSAESVLVQSNSTRLLSCFRRGFLIILASVIKGIPLPQGSFIPDFSPAPG